MTTRRAASGGRTLIALFLRFALLLRPAHGLGDRAGAGVWGPVAPSVHARPDKRLSRAGLHYAWPDAVKAHHAGRAERHARANPHLAAELANASHGHLLRDAWHSLPGTNLATSGR